MLGLVKGTLENDHVREVALGTRSLHKLFTKEQRAFYAEHAPDGLALEDLSLLGPVFVLKLKFEPEDYARKLVAELWLYPDGSRILEFSTKCVPGEAFQVAAESRALDGTRDRPLGRATDQDQSCPRVLRGRAISGAGLREIDVPRVHANTWIA